MAMETGISEFHKMVISFKIFLQETKAKNHSLQKLQNLQCQSV